MSNPLWNEFARLQRLASKGYVQEEQLDSFLVRYCDQRHTFDLRDCRRRQKNLGRNLGRKSRNRQSLLREQIRCLGSRPVEPPMVIVLRGETCATVRQAASDDWELLRATIDGDYTAIAKAAGVAIGTLKSRVSRARHRLRSILRRAV